MPGKQHEIEIGARYGSLVAVGKIGSGGSGVGAVWLWDCDCGAQIERPAKRVCGSRFKNQSCGCLVRLRSSQQLKRHGESYPRSPEYRTWRAMIGRCTNPSCNRYENYGGAGISVCERWKKYENFLADMGRKPSPQHSIDRIDGAGNYEPGNCRWASQTQQQRNRSNTKFIEIDGKTIPFRDACDLRHLPYDRVDMRLRSGWSIEEALEMRPRAS